MKYLAAYCLLSLGGKASPSEKDLKDFFTKLGQEVNEEQIKQVVSSCNGKQLHELCQKGQSKLGSISLGGGSQGGNAPAQSGNAKKEEKKVEEKPKTEEEEEDVDVGGFFD